MRKKIAVIVVLATIAASTGSMYSHLLHAEQHTATETSSAYTIVPGNITTYDFSSNASVDRWAYRPEASQDPPATTAEPSTLFTEAQYSRIATDDAASQTDGAPNKTCYAAHRFVFSIAENRSTITSLTIMWNGSGWHDQQPDGATLYAWNLTSGSYDELDNTQAGTDTTLAGTLSPGLDYIASDGNITILAVQPHSTKTRGPNQTPFLSHIATDYVKVDVTHTGGT